MDVKPVHNGEIPTHGGSRSFLALHEARRWCWISAFVRLASTRTVRGTIRLHCSLRLIFQRQDSEDEDALKVEDCRDCSAMKSAYFG